MSQRPTRAAISQPNHDAAPTSTLVTATPTTSTIIAGRLPTRSSQRPLGSDSAIRGSRYASATHSVTVVRVPNASSMLGSATATMLMSSAAMKTLSAAAITSHHRFRSAIGRSSCRGGQQFILMALWDEDGLTPGELARRLGLATPTVTKATHRMEAAGLVVRQPHPTDGRLVRIHLTERGAALRKELDGEMYALSERCLATFTDRERATFVNFLDRLRANLQGDGGGGRPAPAGPPASSN